MIKEAIRNVKYDYLDQSYATLYPQLHKYPATMLPQIGVDILKELNIKSDSKLLDPYCGSGSSFASAVELGIQDLTGYDINPLAILISSVKFTKINIKKLNESHLFLRDKIYSYLKRPSFQPNLPQVKNFDFWFKPNIAVNLAIVKHFIDEIQNKGIKNFFTLIFSELVRECSNTRNNEFKLFKMKDEDILIFNPDVIGLFFQKCEKAIKIYQEHYFGKSEKIKLYNKEFDGGKFDIVLTSPPYGDSRTTVAYGQFSTLSNEWLGINEARSIDRKMMGGIKAKKLIQGSIISDYLNEISFADNKRALEVSGFYIDLKVSIDKVANSINKGGKAVYVVGNRMVKGVRLPTDKFIAECFVKNGFRHLMTYERLLSNKSMPKRNSPTNQSGITKDTMNFEYIVCCKK